MLRYFSYYLIGHLLGICVLQSQIVPSDPVLDFRLPRFSNNGYPQWILRGGKGIYDNAEQIRIEEMSLRVYSGDQRKFLEMTIDSPKATFLIEENSSVSESPIEIVGTNFKVSGVGWKWDGSNKEIHVNSDVVVEFSQEVTGMLSGRASDKVESTEGTMTEISSDSLSLKTTPEAYHFQFSDLVNVTSGDTRLKSDLLVAIADVPKSNDAEETAVTDLEFDSIDQIIATGQVSISQAGNLLKAEEAKFSLRDQSAEFIGNPSIESSGALVSGQFIRSEEGEVIVNGNGASERAIMIVHKVGGLGVAKEIPLDQETTVFANTIKMQELEVENLFSFEGAVEATSGAVSMRADTLDLYFNPALDGETSESVSDVNDDESVDFRLGKLVRVVGEGSVQVEQEDQTASCDRAVFYPQKERVLLSGNSKMSNEQATITGNMIELQRGSAVVNGTRDEPAKVILPELPDLGAGDFELMNGIQLSRGDEADKEQPEVVKSETVVKADTLLMTEKPDHYLLNFTDKVSVEGTNLKAFCSRMDVVLIEREDRSKDENRMQVQSIHAYEDVVFEQIGRRATADEAMIRPVEGEVVLEGNASLTDVQGNVAGHRITIHKGKGRATVEGDGTEGSRARLTLPEMDLPENVFP